MRPAQEKLEKLLSIGEASLEMRVGLTEWDVWPVIRHYPLNRDTKSLHVRGVLIEVLEAPNDTISIKLCEELAAVRVLFPGILDEQTIEVLRHHSGD
jgi:hypothetical protein